MAGRVKAQWAVDVDRAPEEVFAYLADISRHGEWSPKPFRTENVPSGPVAQGARYTSYGWIPGDKQHRNDVVVTEVDPPQRFALESTEPDGGTFVNTFTITPTAGGCRVEREMDMPKPSGFMGAVFPAFLRGYIKPAVQKGMNAFKRNVEAAASSPS